MRRSCVGISFGLLLAAVGSPARAQAAERLGAQGSMDQSVELPSGRVVHVRNLVVFRGNSGSSLTIYAQTTTPAADSVRLAREAEQIVARYAEYSSAQRVDRVSVTICRTVACVELRERSDERFEFERGADSAWHPTKR